MRVEVGTCGFPISREKYYRLFNAVELQETFYNIPSPERMAMLKEEAPEGFTFAVKVWQVITHESTSPTWKKVRTKLTGRLENYGGLKPTEENFKAWEQFVEAVRPLGAKFYVFQTPPSLRPSNHIFDFFSSIVGKFGGLIAWEPRGRTYEDMSLIRRVVDLGVIHVVDPLKRNPLRPGYYRLHGLGSSEVNYRYKYTDEDLRRLREVLLKLGGGYVMFNNVHMLDDALRFKRLLSEGL